MSLATPLTNFMRILALQAMQESGYKDRYEASTTAPEDSNIPGDEAHQPLRAP